jgi:hypothetical protein
MRWRHLPLTVTAPNAVSEQLMAREQNIEQTG